MTKPKILVQLDTDDQASVFDSVVAIDAGAEHLLRHQAITPENIRERVHGAIFTRGPDDLKHTALFVGGSDVARGEQVLAAIVASFIGPLRTSVMMDSGGANTTAAAAVLAAARHLDLASAQCSCWRPRGRSANAWPGCSRRGGKRAGCLATAGPRRRRRRPHSRENFLRADQRQRHQHGGGIGCGPRGRNPGRGSGRRRRRAAAATGDRSRGEAFGRDRSQCRPTAGNRRR